MPPLRRCRALVICALGLCLPVVGLGQNTNNNVQSLEQAASSARDAGNADEAIRDYQRLLELRPTWAQGWWDLGTLQYQTNRYADAIVSLSQLTALAPHAAQAWSILGLSQFETKDYSDALASLEKAQKLGPLPDQRITRVTAYHLALLLIRTGNFDRAVALLHSTFPESPPAQAKTAMGLALLRVPLLPSEVDPTKDALIHAAGEAAADPNPQQALAALIQQYPKIPWLHYAYGLALAAANKDEEALAQQELETTMSPASPLPWLEIGRLSQILKQPGEALTAHRHVESLQPAPPRNPRTIALYTSSASPNENSATWSAAMRDYSAGKYPEAIATLKSFVEQYPADGTAWAVLGLSEFAQKDYDNARIHLQRGIDLGLKASSEAVQFASDHLALLLIRDRQFESATSLLRPLAGHPPMAQQTQLALGLSLLRIPALPVSLNPGQRALAQSAGAIVELLFASRYTEAFAAYQKLIAANPTTPWLHYDYAKALDSISRYDDAKIQLKAEMKISPRSELPWISLAAISLRLHLPADALQQAQTAVALAPQSAEAHYQLGRAWLESGNTTNAITELNHADTLKPDTAEIHFALARAYARDHQPQKAAAERATFTQLKSLETKDAQPGAQPQSILNSDSQ